jgi:long-chain acyl-CoA synthetase
MNNKSVDYDKIARVFDLLTNLKTNYPKETIIGTKKNGKWITYSTDEFYKLTQYFSSGLIELGFRQGDKIATITTNTPEWNIIDMALAQLGIIHIPIYPNLSKNEYNFIINHSESVAAFVFDQKHYDILHEISENIEPLKNHIFSFSPVKGAKCWKEILELGEKTYEKNKSIIEQVKSQIKEDDLLTIIYTSGTTGVPKGVMLTHKNILSNVKAIYDIHPLTHKHKVVSFLPLCHVYERMLNYLYLMKGITIYYIGNLSEIAKQIKEIKPDSFNTVPRVLEIFYDKIVAVGKDLEGFKKKLFFWAINLGFQFDLYENNWKYKLKLQIAKKLVYKKVKEALGGNLKMIVSGGSALQVNLQRLFWALGIKVIEGYGLTETSPVLTVNRLNVPDIKFGTVGLPLENVQVKIAEDGEILAKGPNVMQGYYKNEEATKEVIDEEGWFHTGDAGILVEGRFLKINGRKKEIFKLSSGKYIAPQLIENKLKSSPLIEQAIVFGENKKFASAIISPNFDYLHFFASKHKIHFNNNKELVKHPEVIKRFQKEINEINKQLSQHENIKRFKVVPDMWSSMTGELTATLKLKRNFIHKKYEDIINDIYKIENEF